MKVVAPFKQLDKMYPFLYNIVCFRKRIFKFSGKTFFACNGLVIIFVRAIYKFIGRKEISPAKSIIKY